MIKHSSSSELTWNTVAVRKEILAEMKIYLESNLIKSRYNEEQRSSKRKKTNQNDKDGDQITDPLQLFVRSLTRGNQDQSSGKKSRTSSHIHK